MLPDDGAAGAHLARASRLIGESRIDCLIGLAVALAGLAEMMATLLFVQGHDLLGWLLRVQVLGLLGLLVSVWGFALLDGAWHRNRTARAAHRAILTGQPGWAMALAGLEGTADRRA
jgi:hypothetical protein